MVYCRDLGPEITMTNYTNYRYNQLIRQCKEVKENIERIRNEIESMNEHIESITKK